MNFASNSLVSLILLSSLVAGCAKDDAGPTGSLKGQVQYNQLISQVEVQAANGKVLTTTPNSYGTFKLTGVPAGAVTVKFLPNPATFPAAYFRPQPKAVTVTAGDTLDMRLLQPLYAEVVSGTVSWIINGQPSEGQLGRSSLYGDPTLPPRLSLQARSATGGNLSLSVAGITGSGTYSTNQSAYISYYDSPTRIRYDVQQGTVTFTTYDPVKRQLTGTAQFRASGVNESANTPSGTSIEGTAAFALQL